MNFITFATGDKFKHILESEHIIEDLRIPSKVKANTRNIIIQGQVWGRRGNTKLISIAIFSGEFNDNDDIKRDIESLLKEKEPSANILYTTTSNTITINIMSRNLANSLKGVNDIITYLENTCGLAENLLEINISTDLPNWKGINYYTSDPFFLLQITQTREMNTLYGIFHIDLEKLDDMVLIMLIQTSLILYPRIIIKTEYDEITKRFLINKIEDLIVETKSQINLTKLEEIVETK